MRNYARNWDNDFLCIVVVNTRLTGRVRGIVRKTA